MAELGLTTRADSSVACTLAEGHYHAGVAGLINSLYRTGFRGEFWVGYRGGLPEWVQGNRGKGEISRSVAPGLIIRFTLVDTERHLTNYKPAFMLSVLDRSGASRIFYFDPDIVSIAPWSFYMRWITNCVALCEDCTYPHFPIDHPFRRVWTEFARNCGFEAVSNISSYFNGGFVGVHASCRAFLTTWECLIEGGGRAGLDLKTLKGSGRDDPFNANDQDMLNVAAMSSGQPLSTIGPEAMGFAPAGYVMQHATDSPKPWKKKYLRRYLLTGDRVSQAHRAYWSHVDGPLFPFSRWQRIQRRAVILLVTALGRFYRR